ncbi:hypothetical protein FHR81_003535 [Actinoalloteichus hoggarensis]|uniref:Uncharacterized protein n=1 Tax=Actinoalloteichus hoggarensis TaxID=1470176 RepID=A0A221W8G5_9PSEU|nr:hypothetical protein [Actinoalloteichus hoggarensis]ASO21886.1 hypothetical protein AHOG_21350 [Actinoalloteichus hoggarensis]MBB5922483.1 hypothetical protein [Actinoalloteichus hoggarensis]
MRDFGSETVRSGGPLVVEHGPPGGPAVLVLDPAGEANHGGLPGTWRSLAERVRVMWCRLPATEAGVESNAELLDELAEYGMPAYLVASGTATQDALLLGAVKWRLVRAVLLIEPDQEDSELDSPVPEGATDRLVRELAARGVPTRIIRRDPVHSGDAVGAPLPLGHPEVVDQIITTMAELESAASELGGPGTRPSLTPQDWTRMRTGLADELRRVRRRRR